MADWNSIKTEYITTKTSYRKLAQKYGISYVTIGAKAREEGWVEQRKQFLDKTFTKTISKIQDRQADKMSRINDLTDRLLDKLEQAVEELDIQLYRNVKKTKTIEYNNELRPDKPTKEVINEEEKFTEVKTIIDRPGLKAITAALRDIKEVQMLKTELDMREQEARIDNLRKQAESDKDKVNAIEVVFMAGEEEWNE